MTASPPEQILFKSILNSDYTSVTACLSDNPRLLTSMKDHYKRAPLNMAIEKDDFKMVRILVDFGASPFTKAYSDHFGVKIPPYHLAKKLNHRDIYDFLQNQAKDKTVLFLDFSAK